MFLPIEQTSNLLPEILEQIKQNIKQGALKKGDRLPTEREWAATLGVSRTTLREAIKSLELLGLVECSQGSGNFISNNLSSSFAQPLAIMFSLEEGTLLQIHQFRHAMELAAVEGAVVVITDEQVAQLSDICAAIEAEQTPQEQLPLLDWQFHLTIAQISGNPLVLTMMHGAEALLEEHVRQARAQIISGSELAYQSINRQHRGILAALAQRNRIGAVQAVQAHMEFISDSYGKMR